MAGTTAILTKGYRIEDAAGVTAGTCLVFGANDGGCKKPTGINVAGFLGVAREDQLTQNKGVPVDKEGIVAVKYGGTITRGDRLRIHSNLGDVESCEAAIVAAPGTAAVFHIVGKAEISGVAGDLGRMKILDFQVNQSVS